MEHTNCTNCDGWIRPDELVICGHLHEPYCDASCARADCGECYEEHRADTWED